MRSIPFFLLIVNFFLFTTNSAFANRAEFITEIVNNLKNNLDELPQEDGNGSMRWNELNGITPEGHECLAYLTISKDKDTYALFVTTYDKVTKGENVDSLILDNSNFNIFDVKISSSVISYSVTSVDSYDYPPIKSSSNVSIEFSNNKFKSINITRSQKQWVIKDNTVNCRLQY